MATIAEALSIAFAHHQRGQIAEAERIYRQIVAAEPTHADAWHLLGVAAHQAGRNAEAVESISRAVSLCGANANYYNHLGAAYAALERYSEAEAAFRQALELAPSDAQTHFNLAALLNLHGRPAEAAESYRRAIELALGAGEVDSLIVIFTPVDPRSAAGIIQAIREGVARARAAGGAGKPVLACVMAEPARPVPLALDGERIPAYTFPENAVRALGKVTAHAAWRR